MRLTIEYPQAAPVWLRINGTSADGRQYGPSLLPDPPRPLSPARETVLLELPDAMDGQVLVLIVSGLDEQHMLRMRGTVRTEVVRHTMQTAFVSLQLGVGCASDRSSSVYCTGDDDAGMSPSHDDAGMPQVSEPGTHSPADPSDAGTTLEPDAAAPEPEEPEPPPEEPPPEEPPPEEPPPEEPPPEEPPPEEPEDSIHVLRCEEGPACDLKCPGGEHCAIDCGGATDCKPTCKNATCEIDCTGSERCQPTCEGRAICEITCGEASCEDVKCRDEAECVVHCTGEDCESDDD